VLLMLPLLGLLVYIIARGPGMADRTMKDQIDAQNAFDDYVRSATSAGGGAASELEKAAALHSSGAISDEEYAALKAKVIGG
jgi:hypothetical protein